MDLLKRMIEGYDEQKAIEILTEKDDWQDVIRAEQNKLIVQAELTGIEIHQDIPCAIVYIGDIKGLIPVHEFGTAQKTYVSSREDLKDEHKINKSYHYMRSMTNQKIAFIIKGHDKKDKIFTASRKEALEWMKKRTEETLAAGRKSLAVIRNVSPVRAIADIGGITATLSAAEYQHGWTEDLTDHLQVGDHIAVQIVDYDKENNHVTISRKALFPDPWEEIDVMERADYVGEIMGARQNGYYFRLKTKNGYVFGFMTHPKHDLMNRGDKVLVRVINIDHKKRRIFGRYLRLLH